MNSLSGVLFHSHPQTVGQASRLSERYFQIRVKNRKEIDFNKINRILVRSTNWIGDVILTFPAIATIRKNFPRSYIAMLSKPWVAPLLENNPEVDEVILYDQKGCLLYTSTLPTKRIV